MTGIIVVVGSAAVAVFLYFLKKKLDKKFAYNKRSRKVKTKDGRIVYKIYSRSVNLVDDRIEYILIFLFFTIASGLAFYNGISKLYLAYRLDSNGVETIGKVERVNEYTFSPRFSHEVKYTYSFFADPNGLYVNSQEFIMSPGYREGQEIEVIYDTKNPHISILAYNAEARWYSAALLVLAAASLLAIPLILFSKVFKTVREFLK